MTTTLEEKFSELHDRINKTCKGRFQADKRLKAHASWAVWSITLTSILLILISLLDGFDLIASYSSKQISVIQILASIFILCYSLILTMKNYSVDAVKMHRCGLELSDLLFEVHPFVEQPGTDDDYDRLREKYAHILSRYDNHDDIDHLIIKSKNKKLYTTTKWEDLKTTVRYWGGFWHYIAVIFIELTLIATLIFGLPALSNMESEQGGGVSSGGVAS